MLKQVNGALGLKAEHRGKIQESDKTEKQTSIKTADLTNPACNQFSKLSGKPSDELSKLKVELQEVENKQLGAKQENTPLICFKRTGG